MPETLLPEIKLFYCYAREDKALRDELELHLSSLKHRYRLTDWYDREILPGADWEEEIDRHLASANLILLLISPHFLASNYCYGKEMKRALERHEAGTCRVVPILVRPTYCEDEPFSHLQMLPTDAKAITSWSNRDEAFEDIARGISRAIKEVLFSRKTSEERLEKSKKLPSLKHHEGALPTLDRPIHLNSKKAGYWIRKDKVVHTATVHDDSSTSPLCRWKGASKGAPKPDSWEHSDIFPQGETTVGNKTVHFIYCERCMKGQNQNRES